MVYNDIEHRTLEEATYIINNNATIRATADAFGYAKSTVHKDVNDRLADISPDLYRKCQLVAFNNWHERHKRGGAATAHKYATGILITKKKEDNTNDVE